MARCEILLAAYNGTRYGPALLDSLLAQTVQDFTLLVRDNGSTDDTLGMLKAYAPRFGGRMRIIEGEPTGSAKTNFSILMSLSTAEHVLCADIDDVWLPHKVAETLTLLDQAEREVPAGTPVFVFTDVTVVDADLQTINPSYFAFKRTDPAISQDLSRLMVCPVMLGCASGMNRALVEMSTPVPDMVTGHDWWALLIAGTFGIVRYSADQTMLYRLHGSNDSAPKRVRLSDYVLKNGKLKVVRRGMQRRSEQAQELINRFGDRLPPNKQRVVKDFVSIASQNFAQRRVSLLKGNYLYPDLSRNLAMLIGV